jgi:hypothetical protein
MAKIKTKNKDFAIKSSASPNGKVSIFIEVSAEIADHLDEIKTRNLTKATYICTLIEADMANNKK